MNTVVEHDSCPYGSNTAPCTATLPVNVTCKVPGAGSFAIEKRPNGFSLRSSETTPQVIVVVQLPNGTNLTLPIPVTLITTNDKSAVSPCGGSLDPTITY